MVAEDRIVNLSYVACLERAWARMKQVLFAPFDDRTARRCPKHWRKRCRQAFVLTDVRLDRR